MHHGQPFEILIVEDDLGSCYLMEAALKGTSVNHRITCVHDGQNAIDLLKRVGVYAQAPRPDLIFLDLHLPAKNGWELLGDIKNDGI